MKTQKKRRIERKLISIEHQALKEMRLELGLTLREAGEKQGLSSKTVGAIENGRISIDKKRIGEIVKNYGLSPLDFERTVRVIRKHCPKKRGKITIRKVLSNEDRRSYQKLITKECKVLKSLRRIKGISQDKASNLCGYPRATIGHIENGRIELSVDRITHILKSYGYDDSEFARALSKEKLRDEIIDECVEKIKSLDDEKLSLIRGVLGSFG